MDQEFADLAHKQAISEVLWRYCRSLDRMDKSGARGVFFDDSTVNYHGIYEGSGQGFVDWVWQAHAQLERHSHQICNVLIELDGDKAVSESYVTVALWTMPDPSGKQSEIVCRGRYLDRMERRENVWAIAQREHLVDMHSVSELNCGPLSEASSRSASDPSWAYFRKESETL